MLYLGTNQYPLSLHRGIGHSIVFEMESDSTLDLSDRTFQAVIRSTQGGARIAEFTVDQSELVSENRLTLDLADTWAAALAADVTEASWDLVAVPASGSKEIWVLPSPVSIASCNSATTS